MFLIRGAMFLGVFFYQTSYYTIHKLLTLRRFKVFPKSIFCIVPGAKGILTLKVG